MFEEEKTYLEDAEELLAIYDLEDILDRNQLTQGEAVARLIELGLIVVYEDMRNK